MKNNGRNYFRCAAAVAITCLEDEKPNLDMERSEMAEYIQNVLEVLFYNADLHIRTWAMPYPKSSKTPILIEIPGQGIFLLWYSPQMDAYTLAEELEGLLYDPLSKVVCQTA